MSGRYKELEYWDSRYEEEEQLLTGGHEWFGAYRDFAHLLRRELRPGTRGLVLGCGTSSLSAELHKEGVRPLVSIDYSPVCIKEMTQRNAGVPDMSWMVMDARHLQFPDGTFDLVIEKGTLDAMMVDEKDPWRVSQDTIALVDEVLSEHEGQQSVVAHRLVGSSPPVDASCPSHSPLRISALSTMHNPSMAGLCHVTLMVETFIISSILCTKGDN
ncbi:EEF1A lysine methyltransferase 4 isoform 2-T2 [Leptodactylus fuscus]